MTDYKIHTDDFGSIDTDPLASSIRARVEREQQRIDYAIRGAIRAGYDGVDINRPADVSRAGLVAEIVPWDRPAPDGANGYRTERYTWDWFSDAELAEILTADRLTDVFEEGDDG